MWDSKSRSGICSQESGLQRIVTQRGKQPTVEHAYAKGATYLPTVGNLPTYLLTYLPPTYHLPTTYLPTVGNLPTDLLLPPSPTYYLSYLPPTYLPPTYLPPSYP